MTFDLQTMLDRQMKALRDAELKYSPQMTVRDLIDALADFDKSKKLKLTDSESPTGFQSWRWQYDELSITYEIVWWSSFEDQPLSDCKIDEFWDHSYECHCWGRPTVNGSLTTATVWEFIDVLTSIIWKVMCWYKGGDFTVWEDTPVWVATYGNSGCNLIWDYENTFIIWVEEKNGEVYFILQTEK